MPAYQLEALLVRIGLALAAGVLIGLVPIAHRCTRYEPSIPKRVFFHLLSLGALIGFCFYAVYLWHRFVPAEPEAPAPVAYPEMPAVPAPPAPPAAP
ncbi:MAG TPA: hypothetical protein PK388_03975 [Kiritimatiellia bacterium]|nr:hypothetical protein [Kiritimatiellia bacterium]